jgi:hypothetical protein
MSFTGVSYTRRFKCLPKWKSVGFKSDKLGGHAVSLPQPIHRVGCKLSKDSWIVIRGRLRHRRCKPWPRAPRFKESRATRSHNYNLTLPVSITEAELSFSVLKRIKNSLRSNIGQDKVSDLSVLFIESSIKRNWNCDQIIGSFARDKERKKAMLIKNLVILWCFFYYLLTYLYIWSLDLW